jgi:predicted ATP-grasp superfamily ATP-dependent carboligase
MMGFFPTKSVCSLTAAKPSSEVDRAISFLSSTGELYGWSSFSTSDSQLGLLDCTFPY